MPLLPFLLAATESPALKGGGIPEGAFEPPPSVGGLDLDSRSSGCARLGGGVAPPLGVVVEEVAVLVVLVRRHCHAVRAAVRRVVDDEISSAIKEETGPAAVLLGPFVQKC